MNQKQIIDAFLDPDLYDHFVEQVEMVETHISWIFLTGSFAYKIKKPVDYGFLNFSTLEQREFYCHQELKLNRRFAPQIYLAVIAVTQSNNKIALAGEGEIIDYAIKMKQFDQSETG